MSGEMCWGPVWATKTLLAATLPPEEVKAIITRRHSNRHGGPKRRPAPPCPICGDPCKRNRWYAYDRTCGKDACVTQRKADKSWVPGRLVP